MRLTFFTIAALIISSASIAQGFLNVEGYTYTLTKENKRKPIADINIKVFKEMEKEAESVGKQKKKNAMRESIFFKDFKSDKKGRYAFSLEYGFIYKIAFVDNDGYVNTNYEVDNRVAADKQKAKPNIQVDIPLVSTDESNVDTLKLRFPFTKMKFDGNKKFIEDAKYINDFQKGLFPEYKTLKTQIKKEEADKAIQAKLDAKIRYIKIGGKIMAGDPATFAIKNMRVKLVDDKGKVVEIATTNKFGKFVFTKLAAERAHSILLDENDSAKFAGQKITIYNKIGEEVLTTTSTDKGTFKYQLLPSDKKTLAMLEVDENRLFIAGSFRALVDNKENVIAKTAIVLVNSITGEIYEKVITDANGGFVFSKLPADQSFLIRLEENNPKLAGVKIKMKDKSGNDFVEAKTDGMGTFRFAFMKDDVEKINVLEISDEELKMDVVGLLQSAEDNKGIANLKLILKDEKNGRTQEVTTGENGQFTFKNISLTSTQSVKLDETDARLKSMKAFTIADISGKAIKEYKVEQENKIQLLTSDLIRLGKFYMK